MGHELRQPLGLAIAGGSDPEQVLTLFTTPVIFLGFETWREGRAHAAPRHARRLLNISAPFIRRPVGTMLLTIGLALAGIAAFFHLPVARCRRWIFPPSWCRPPARRQPFHHGQHRGQPAGTASGHDCGGQRDDLAFLAGLFAGGVAVRSFAQH
jgi:hypothetical protein